MLGVMLRPVMETLPRGLPLSAVLCSSNVAAAELLYGLPELVRKAHKAQEFEDSFLADAGHRHRPVAHKDGAVADSKWDKIKIGRQVA